MLAETVILCIYKCQCTICLGGRKDVGNNRGVVEIPAASVGNFQDGRVYFPAMCFVVCGSRR